MERTAVSLDIIMEWASGRREARISDVSLGGCYIDSIANLRSGEKISFKVKVAEEEWLELSGEVAYALPGFGFGVRFDPLSDVQKSILEHLILMHNGNPWAADALEALR